MELGHGHIQLLTGIALLFGVVLGAYSLFLLNILRQKYRYEYLNSFFYFQLLVLLFGLYGIAGNLLLQEILPKLDLNELAIEAVFLYLPFLGLPFIIAAWYLLLKFATEIINKRISSFIGIAYFALTTAAFLFYGYYLIRLAPQQITILEENRQQIFFIFSLSDVLLSFSIALFLIINANSGDKLPKIFFVQFAGTFFLISILSAICLHYIDQHFSAGIYYILLFFSGPLPLVLLLRYYLPPIENKSTGDYRSMLFDKFRITPREQEIIIEICQGKTNKQIAHELFITLQTVKDHTHNIYQKTLVKNRVMLAQLFSRGNQAE